MPPLAPIPENRDFTPLPAVPRVGGVSPALRAHVHHLVETYPQESLRVIREWMAEGPSSWGLRH